MNSHPRLNFLDGIRGLCALYITIYHAQLYAGHWIKRAELEDFLKPWHFFFSYGSYAVPIFLVLSGYCLTIPIAIKNEKKLNRGFSTYIKRRARRILPPYYVALGLILALIMVVPILQVPHNTNWDTKLPINAGVILSHLLLVHNVSKEWLFKINGPMWSIAIEWQLYFVFPVLLFFWRKLGLIGTTALSLFVGISLSKLSVTAHVMHVWFLGLFVLGMLAAAVSFSKEKLWSTLRNKIEWNIFTPVVVVLTLTVLALDTFTPIDRVLLDLIVGFGACSIIVQFALIELKQEQRPWLLKILNSKVAEKLGVASYSIYLIHSPIQGLINLLALPIEMTPTWRLLFMVLVAVPVSMGISYLFYLLVERRFVLNPVTKKEALAETKANPDLVPEKEMPLDLNWLQGVVSESSYSFNRTKK